MGGERAGAAAVALASLAGTCTASPKGSRSSCTLFHARGRPTTRGGHRARYRRCRLRPPPALPRGAAPGRGWAAAGARVALRERAWPAGSAEQRGSMSEEATPRSDGGDRGSGGSQRRKRPKKVAWGGRAAPGPRSMPGWRTSPRVGRGARGAAYLRRSRLSSRAFAPFLPDLRGSVRP